MNKYYQQIVYWNLLHGISQTIEGQRELTQREWQEFHNAKTLHEKKKEASDALFTSAQLHYQCTEAKKDVCYHTSYIEAKREVNRLNAWNYVEATIKSNYSKYIKATSSFRMIDASKLASRVAEHYKGRYTSVVPVRTGDHFFIKGIENGVEKVLKPLEHYKPVEEFL